MKIIIQIPCLNEEANLPAAIAALPRHIEGASEVKFLVIDDGSTDRTSEVARSLGVHIIVRHTARRGLAHAFMTGIDEALRQGADIIVNCDADNQYAASDIPALVRPIIERRADVVIGNRQVDTIQHFSWFKKRMQHLGSWVVRRASGTNVPDSTSGFRAISREAALRINVLSDFTYTLETIIQLGRLRLAVGHVPVGTNAPVRPSRLFQSTASYVTRSASTIVRTYVMYWPLKVFLTLGIMLFAAGFGLGMRFLYYYVDGHGDGKIQSLILATILMVIGFQTSVTGLLADLIGRNRQLAEATLFRVRRMELAMAEPVESTAIEPLPAATPRPKTPSGAVQVVGAASLNT